MFVDKPIHAPLVMGAAGELSMKLEVCFGTWFSPLCCSYDHPDSSVCQAHDRIDDVTDARIFLVVFSSPNHLSSCHM